MKLLILLVVVVRIIAVAQLARVCMSLQHKLRKTREEEISYADNRLNAALDCFHDLILRRGDLSFRCLW